MTRHHLRTRKGDPRLIEIICEDCHRYIHKLFTNKQLRGEDSPLNTVEGLMENPEFAKAIGFVKTHDPGRRLTIRTSKRRGRR